VAKPKVAFYWAASCGGCEIAILEMHEKLLEVAEQVEIVFWPVAIDTKYKDVEAMADGEIDVTFFNGAIRTGENEHLAKLLRQKSKILIAFGSCAMEGCIPGLANLYTKESIFDRVYSESPSTDNPEGVRPQPTHEVPEGTVKLPVFWDRVSTLADVVEVDYFVPGCSPAPKTVAKAFETILSGNLPPKGAVLGASDLALCEECPRERHDKKVKRFYRPYEIVDDGKTCLLEQGIICAGVATRGGCGALCIKANMPCRGCYGPTPESDDQGTALMAAIASMVDSNDPDEIKRVLDEIPDPVGLFWRFSLAKNPLIRARDDEPGAV
jgi:F420-non-reducing hydrogenase small subunit